MMTDIWANLPSRVKPSSTFDSEVSTIFAVGLFADGLFATGLFDSSTVAGTSITNTNATADAGNRYNICMRTGFKVKPHSLVEDSYGALVRHDSYDMRHPQEFIRPLAEEITGPTRPESTDTFLSASVSPEDL